MIFYDILILERIAFATRLLLSTELNIVRQQAVAIPRAIRRTESVAWVANGQLLEWKGSFESPIFWPKILLCLAQLVPAQSGIA